MEKVTVSAQMLDVNFNSGYAVFRQDVTVQHKKMLLSAQKMEVFYNTDASNALEKIIASENLTLKVGSDTATGERAEYLPAQQEVTLSGNVLLTRGGNSLRGEQLIYNIPAGTVRMQGRAEDGGRIRAVFTPQEGTLKPQSAPDPFQNIPAMPPSSLNSGASRTILPSTD